MLYEKENNLTKSLMNGLYNLSVDVPEIAGIVEEVLRENEIQMPSKAPSSVDI